MGSFRIKYRASFEREIRKVPQQYVNRIAAHIDSLSLNPFPSGSKKLGGEDVYRIRVRDYRIVYSLDTHEKTIIIEMVKHRKDVYRKL
jgi:mRNA interferase RelE/StbE